MGQGVRQSPIIVWVVTGRILFMRPVIIVSGASSSLGVILCQELVENGYKVYAGYHFNRAKILRNQYIVPIKLDITSSDSCKKAISKTISKEKSFFALINLVAISPSGETLDFSVSDFQKILDVNVVGSFRLIHEVLPKLPKNGRIINIGSLSGLISFPKFSLYSASKFALRAMSLSLYYEWLPKRRYVIHIAPGAITKFPVSPPPPGSARDRIPALKWILPLVTPQKVSQKIIACLKDPNPPAEILIGIDTLILTVIKRFSPEILWNSIQNFVWKKQQ